MRNLAGVLVAAFAAAEQEYIETEINVDGTMTNFMLTTKEWSNAEFAEGNLHINGNNSMFIRKEARMQDSAIYKPLLRGGSIMYDVDLSSQDSGCVAGVYLVNTNNGDCGEFDQYGTPMCKTVDAMQANLFGFETKANPCRNGTCDAISECIAGMQYQGIQEYGEGAYGPGGSIIDTYQPFNVHNEFVSTLDYKKFWKLRTTLKQHGETIVMEADCRKYLKPMNREIEGRMGIVISNWDNTEGKEDFELEWSQQTTSSCKNANSIFTNLKVNTYGSNEEMGHDDESAEEGFLKFNIDVNGNTAYKYLTTKAWSEAQVYTDSKQVQIKGNNSLFLRNEETLDDDSIFKTYLLGGAIEYDVNVADTKSGCVAGLYMVETDNGTCGEVDQYGRPMCKSIDAMQANLFGFESKAHPCANGTCDAVSQCIASMQEQGVEKYGKDAYGPFGTIINTNISFHVLNEFISTKDYSKLWKLKTTLKQDGREIEMEADCRDYLDALYEPIEGGMGFVFSNWDNSAGEEDFEVEHKDQVDLGCDNSISYIANFTVHTWGHTEDMPPVPEPEPEPTPGPEPEPVAQFHEFEAHASYWNGDWKMHVKGLDERHVSTEGKTVKLGYNNRAWINDYPYDNSIYWAYRHNYLAGSMSFDIDLSNVDCACKSGVYLVDYDYENCSWDEKSQGDNPQCARFEVMEANKWKFSTAAYPCDFEVCEEPTKSRADVNFEDGQYGPGPFFIINTEEPFNVAVRFWTKTNWRLSKVETILSQNGQSISLFQEDNDYFHSLYSKLYYGMAAVISNFDSPKETAYRDKCAHECGLYSSKFSNFEWKDYNSWDR